MDLPSCVSYPSAIQLWKEVGWVTALGAALLVTFSIGFCRDPSFSYTVAQYNIL